MRIKCILPMALLLLEACKATSPSSIETTVMTKAKHTFLIRNKKSVNPIKVTPQTIGDGREAFSHYCIACHGLDGQNTGVPFADSMSPPVPSLSSREVQSYTDGQLKWVIEHGIKPSGMPGANGILSDEEQWEIVVFIRHLPPAGSLGEPSIYSK